MKKRVKLISTVLLLAAVLLSAAVIREYTHTKSSGRSVTVSIARGSSGENIADALKEAGVIRFKSAFRLKLKLSPDRDKLNYGKYKLEKDMPYDDIIESLKKPSANENTLRLTVPEGYSAEMIAQKCEELGICTSAEFLRELEGGSFEGGFIADIPMRNSVKYKLQGYLFPDTYEFTTYSAAHDVIQTMLTQFEKKYNSVKNENKTDMSMDQIITVASLIEREAKADNERPLISGVIQNRLKADMPLQIDASVVYAISGGLYENDRVYYKDLETDSPYNTYKNTGLPIGAICNPGIKSIEAAMQPADHSYLYYRTDTEKNDGSHTFSETFAEHKSK